MLKCEVSLKTNPGEPIPMTGMGLCVYILSSPSPAPRSDRCASKPVWAPAPSSAQPDEHTAGTIKGEPSPHPCLPAASGRRRAPLAQGARSRWTPGQRPPQQPARALRTRATRGARALSRRAPGRHARTHDARSYARRTTQAAARGRGAQATAEAAGRRPLGPCAAGALIHL